MKVLLVLPLLVCLLTTVLSTFLWRHKNAQRWLAILGSILLLGGCLAILLTVCREGIISTAIGNWPAPFGIVLVADMLSALMLVVTAVIALAVSVYSSYGIGTKKVSFGFYPLFLVLILGVIGAFLTGDLFNLYVWFEVMLMASFVLLVLGAKSEQVRGAIVYLSMNLFASALFLMGVGLLYSVTGTLNMAHLAVRAPAVPGDLKLAISAFLLVAFGIKSAVFPLFFWLPASYHAPPVAVSAVFAGLLTKVGVYSLLRVFTLIFPLTGTPFQPVLLAVAGLTMLTGVFGAASQVDLRRILSFHIISQIGYMVMGLALFSLGGVAASVFYIVHHIIVKANLFLVSGVVRRVGGSFALAKLSGVMETAPLVAVLFLIPAFSLAGIPPLSGFFAKLGLVQAGLELKSYTIVAVALVVGLLTLYSMMKIWNAAFFGEPPEPGSKRTRRLGGGEAWGLLTPCAFLALVTLGVSFGAPQLYGLAEIAADQLLNPRVYVEAVLEGP